MKKFVKKVVRLIDWRQFIALSIFLAMTIVTIVFTMRDIDWIIAKDKALLVLSAFTCGLFLVVSVLFIIAFVRDLINDIKWYWNDAEYWWLNHGIKL